MARRGASPGFSGFTTSTSPSPGWMNPFEPLWTWLDVCDMDSWRWVANASCHDIDPDVFFKAEKQYNRQFLKRLCDGCVVETACLEHALVTDERGWWGGTSDEERKQLMKGID